MNRWLIFLGTSGLVAAAAGLVACNGLLGIGAASLESEDAGVDASGTLSCANYCNLIDKNCAWTSNHPEFLSVEACMQVCPVFDPGNGIGPTNDDTLGCRIHYAQLAAKDPEANCAAAGALGGGVCGKSACVDFCGIDIAYCSAAPVNTPAYSSTTDCLSSCEDGGYPYLHPDAGGELFNAESGNTLNCRTWHLNNAFNGGMLATLHCPHTEKVSAVCHN
jgi:hypothetical protein